MQDPLAVLIEGFLHLLKRESMTHTTFSIMEILGIKSNLEILVT